MIPGHSLNFKIFRRWSGALLSAALIAGLASAIHVEAEDDTRLSAPAPAATVATVAPTPSLEEVTERLNAQAQEIEMLREALRQQQELTASLAAKLNAGAPAAISSTATAVVTAPPVGAPTPENPGPQQDLAQKVAALETQVATNRSYFEQRLKNFGPFAFSGDFRLRAEPTFGGPVDQSQDRFRQRIRLRFNADARLNDQIRGGFSLASGDLDDPISTNQTLSEDGTRKVIAIDKAWATYNPSWFRPLTLTGGKFAYSWANTELVWDKDLNPEGASETLAFNTETPALRKVAVVTFQLPFAKNTRTAPNDKSIYNTVVYGEQLQSSWRLGSRARLSAYASYYDWRYADSIALSLLVPNSSSPVDGLLAIKNVGVENSLATVTVTNALTGAKTLTSAQFASKFGNFDALAQLDFTTPSERWPVSFVGDFVDNTQACANLGNIVHGAILSAPCDPRARHGYWLEASTGRTLKKGDWQFSYARVVIEREAVLGTFNYSEIFPSTDVEIHRPEVLYQLFDNVTLQINGLFGRPLADAGTKGAVRPLWERLQFDMTYKF